MNKLMPYMLLVREWSELPSTARRMQQRCRQSEARQKQTSQSTFRKTIDWLLNIGSPAQKKYYTIFDDSVVPYFNFPLEDAKDIFEMVYEIFDTPEMISLLEDYSGNTLEDRSRNSAMALYKVYSSDKEGGGSTSKIPPSPDLTVGLFGGKKLVKA